MRNLKKFSIEEKFRLNTQYMSVELVDDQPECFDDLELDPLVELALDKLLVQNTGFLQLPHISANSNSKTYDLKLINYLSI